MNHAMDDDKTVLDEAAEQVIELGNRLLEVDEDADSWDVADGLLAGAIQFWLYSRQPCDDPRCENCAEVSTAELRMRKMLEEARRWARETKAVPEDCVFDFRLDPKTDTVRDGHAVTCDEPYRSPFYPYPGPSRPGAR